MEISNIIRKLTQGKMQKDELKKIKGITVFYGLFIVLVFTFVILQRRTVVVDIDNDKHIITTYQKTFEKVLESNNILLDSKDKIDKDLSAWVERNDTINIKKAMNLSVIAGVTKFDVKSAEDNIDVMLKAEGFVIGAEDIVSPDVSEKLTEGMAIDIKRVRTIVQSEKVPIEYKTVFRTDNNLLSSHSKTLQEGKNGEKEVTLKYVYENGKEAVKEIVKEVILKEPINKVMIKGTLPVFTISRGGSTIGYSREFVSKTTAYYAINGIGKTFTASGRKAVRNPNGYSTVAVDTSVIPFGTKLYIEGYGYAIAADTGTAIKGNIIDVYFDTYAEAIRWAVKNVKVYVLR